MKHIPNAYIRPPSVWAGTYSPAIAQHSVRKTQPGMISVGGNSQWRILQVVFVATRPIENEEMFVDYRLSPQYERPSW